MKYILSILLLFILAAPAMADTVVRSGDQVSVIAEQSIEGNFYAIGNSVAISGNSTQDLTMIGGRVRVNGAVAGDVLAVGVTAGVDGPVSGDVRALAGDVTVAGAVSGDLVVVGGSVQVLSSARIEGDVLVYGGTVMIDGAVAGDVLGYMNSLTLNAPVTGDVNVTVDQLEVGNQAVINGTVRYTSNNLLTQAFNATIVGDTVRNDPVSLTDANNFVSLITGFLVVLLASLVWLFLSRMTLARVTAQTLGHIPRSALSGALTLIVLPIIVAVLALSYLGVFIAMVLFFGYVTLFLLACAALPAMIGSLALQLLNQPATTLSPLTLAIGALVCCAVFLVPVVGLSVVFVGVVVALGGLTESVIKAGR